MKELEKHYSVTNYSIINTETKETVNVKIPSHKEFNWEEALVFIKQNLPEFYKDIMINRDKNVKLWKNSIDHYYFNKHYEIKKLSPNRNISEGDPTFNKIIKIPYPTFL